MYKVHAIIYSVKKNYWTRMQHHNVHTVSVEIFSTFTKQHCAFEASFMFHNLQRSAQNLFWIPSRYDFFDKWQILLICQMAVWTSPFAPLGNGRSVQCTLFIATPQCYLLNNRREVFHALVLGVCEHGICEHLPLIDGLEYGWRTRQHRIRMSLCNKHLCW